jgi:hypothetical protein
MARRLDFNIEGNEKAQRQVARQMLTAMRIAYQQALNSAGLSKEEALAMAKSAFGNAGAIVNDAVKGLAASLSVRAECRGRRLSPGNGLE